VFPTNFTAASKAAFAVKKSPAVANIAV